MAHPDPGAEWRRTLTDDELVGRGELEPDDVAFLESTAPDFIHATLHGASEVAAGLMLADGPGRVRDEVLAPLAAVHHRAGPAGGGVINAMAALDMKGVLAAVGLEPEPVDAAVDLLPQLAEQERVLEDGDRTRLALTAAALRVSNYVTVFVGGAVDEPFVPGQEYGPDLQEFARYLIRAVRAEADAADVAPAWTSLAEHFPLRLQAGTVSWLHLLWAGYGMYTRLAGYPPGEVAEQIHGFIRRIAQR